MNDQIGMAAGDVYRLLQTNGPSSISRIQKQTGYNPALVNQAIGWLAREDKVIQEKSGRATHWRLAGVC